jgi:hypothetical protein
MKSSGMRLAQYAALMRELTKSVSDLSVDMRVIFKWSLWKMDFRVWTGFRLHLA